MGSTAAAGCVVTLPRMHFWQSLHHSPISAAILGHTTLAASNRRVARIPGCASVWRAVKTCRRSATSITGRDVPVDTSHNSVMPFRFTGLMIKEEKVTAR
jgi:hypothetical protein